MLGSHLPRTNSKGDPHVTVAVDDAAIGEAALRYAWHGWPIAPGGQPTPPRDDGWPAPLPGALPYRGPMSTNDVVRHWHHPHPVLLAAGLTIDAFQLSQRDGTALLDKLGQHGPVAALPDGHWLLFIETGQPLPEELLGPTVRYHGAGSWVPLPPTRLGQRQLTWHIDPASTGWRLFRRDWFASGPRPAPPPRPLPQPHAPLSTLRPGSPPASPPRSRRPHPRHYTPRLASDCATFQVTSLNQEGRR